MCIFDKKYFVYEFYGHENKMKRNDLNISIYEKFFGGELEASVEPNYNRRSDAR